MLSFEYIAGLFDGEGYVYIFKKARHNHIGYYLSTGITMTHRPILEELHKEFGGHLNGNRVNKLNPNHRTQFQWGLANSLAADFLKTILPYSRIKKDEIEVGLALQNHINLIGYPKKEQREEIRAYREELFQKCKALKERQFEEMSKKFEDGRFGTPVRKSPLRPKDTL